LSVAVADELVVAYTSDEDEVAGVALFDTEALAPGFLILPDSRDPMTPAEED
jgi:hypothetical protein